MAKIKDSVWAIFGQSLKLYFTNFGSFFKYMAFPVFGQILGMILIVGAASIYAANLPKWVVKGGILDNFLMIFLILFIITLPGLIVLIKAFWDFLVAYGAVNSMLDNMLKSGRVYDFHAHTEVITRRSASFGALWLLLALAALIATFPLFWVIAGILFVYCILVFQVFAYEPDKSPIGCFKKSITIIKGNFARTVLLAVLVGGLSYWILPELMKFLFDFANILGVMAIPVDPLVRQLPIESMNQLLVKFPMACQITSLGVAKCVVASLLSYVVSSLLLPLRVICWGLWYKNLNKAEVKLDKKILDRAEGKD